MGRELVLASTRAVPRILESVGFRFEFPTLEDAVRFQLGRA
jgi:NAD dependent epimerase/dehydratase family enzyme